MVPRIPSHLLSLALAPALLAQGSPGTATATPDSGLGACVRIEADGAPIDVSVGHAAPYLFDLDGDGVRDLLVGEFGTGKFPDDRLPKATLEKWGSGSFNVGKLRVYKNHGTSTEPRFRDFRYLQAGTEPASIPTT